MVHNLSNLKYEIHLVEGVDLVNPSNDNVDVEVEFENGARYCATFFTLSNIELILGRYRKSGECASGLYFWSSDPIIVRELTRDTIETVVATLIAEGEFQSAFAGPV